MPPTRLFFLTAAEATPSCRLKWRWHGVSSRTKIRTPADPNAQPSHRAGADQRRSELHFEFRQYYRQRDARHAVQNSAVLTDKPLHSIIARPEIKTISDLRGKKIGTQRIGGLRPSRGRSRSFKPKGSILKSVQFVTLGGDEPVRVEILKKDSSTRFVPAARPGPSGARRIQYSRRTEGFENRQSLSLPSQLRILAPRPIAMRQKRFYARYCAVCASCTSTKRETVSKS